MTLNIAILTKDTLSSWNYILHFKKAHKRYFEVEIVSLITLMSFHINKTIVSSKISSNKFHQKYLNWFSEDEHLNDVLRVW